MEEIDLKELISIFLERKLLIILVIVIFAMLGAIYTLKFVVPEYKTSTSLALVQLGSERSLQEEGSTTIITANDLTINTKLVENYREIAGSRAVAKGAVDNLDLNMSPEDLQKITQVITLPGTEVISITVTHHNPALAARIANEIAKVCIEKVNDMYKAKNLSVLDEAEVPTAPCNIYLAKNITIFACAGAALVVIYILLINMLDTTVKSDTDIEKALQLPVLASIMQTDENVKKKKRTSSRKNSSRLKNTDIKDVKIPYSYNELLKNVDNNLPKRTIRRKDGQR